MTPEARRAYRRAFYRRPWWLNHLRGFLVSLVDNLQGAL